MATLIESMIERAKADKKTIVLPEGNDDRILAAACTCRRHCKYCDIR